MKRKPKFKVPPVPTEAELDRPISAKDKRYLAEIKRREAPGAPWPQELLDSGFKPEEYFDKDGNIKPGVL